MQKFFLATVICLSLINRLHAQSVAINSEGLPPHPSAILDVRSSGKGMLIPRMSQDDRDNIVSPALGLMIFQTTGVTGYYYYDGGWKTLGDNLGNHRLTEALKLGSNRITQTDDNVGLSINDRGALTIRQKAISTIPSDTVAKDNFVFGNDGSFLARGKYLTGQIPMTGAGMRMMWWPLRGAFRAGNATSTEWDSINIKDYSFAYGNQVTSSGYASFAMGDQVTVTSTVGTGFGSAVRVSGTAGFSAGASNVTGGFCGVSIGYNDSAMGQGAVALGYRVLAREDYSVALGYRGRAIHTGSLVLSDASSVGASISTYTSSSASNQMTARYANGYRFFTNDDMNIGVSLIASDNSWNIISDSNRKERFLPANAEQMLGKLKNIRLGSWNYKGVDKPGLRHYGPMAQDFYTAFGRDAHGTIGNDSTINQANLEGVLMILVKGLEERTASQANEIVALREQNELLSAQVASTTKMQQDLAALLGELKKADAAKASQLQPDMRKLVAEE